MNNIKTDSDFRDLHLLYRDGYSSRIYLLAVPAILSEGLLSRLTGIMCRF